MKGRMEDDKKICLEFLKRFSVTLIREIAQDVENNKTKRLEALFTRYIGCKDIECFSVEWDINVHFRKWEDDIDWDIVFLYKNKHSVTLKFYRDQLCGILCATNRTKCIVRYYKNEVYIDKITEAFMPTTEELECIRLVLGIGIRSNCHDLDGKFNNSAIKYFYKHVWSCFTDDNHFYHLESVYTVLLIHKHCPDSLLARLSKDVLKLILVKCI